MTTRKAVPARQDPDRFGRAVAARLDAGVHELPHDVRERLRAARMQALQQRKRVEARHAAPVLRNGGGTATLTPPERLGFWGRLGSVLPLVLLAAGLVLIHTIESDLRATELAEVDAALLTDDLPPAAYTDPGFAHFLRTHGE